VTGNFDGELRLKLHHGGFRAGAPRHVLCGWQTDSMFRRYAIIDERDLRDAVLKLARTPRHPAATELSSELTNQDRGPYEQDRSPEKSSHTSLLRPFFGVTISHMEQLGGTLVVKTHATCPQSGA
jgi:hypothetical protein